jgi:FlaG/FlaF family flagellin (archaellin)
MNPHAWHLRLMVVLLAAGCGGSSSSAASKFIGNWAAIVHTTRTCGDSVGQGDSSVTIPIAAGSGADLESTSSDGCVFKFRVSGDTATLSNAPVSCNAAVPSIPGTTTVNDYTLTTNDGHHATLSSSGTLAENTETCTFTITGSATK